MKSLTILVLLTGALLGCEPSSLTPHLDSSTALTTDPLRSEDVLNPQSQFEQKLSSYCRSINRITNWLHEEFPNKNYELLHSSENVEIWKDLESQPYVKIISFIKIDKTTLNCTFNFSDETQLDKAQDAIINTLEYRLIEDSKGRTPL